MVSGDGVGVLVLDGRDARPLWRDVPGWGVVEVHLGVHAILQVLSSLPEPVADAHGCPLAPSSHERRAALPPSLRPLGGVTSQERLPHRAWAAADPPTVTASRSSNTRWRLSRSGCGDIKSPAFDRVWTHAHFQADSAGAADLHDPEKAALFSMIIALQLEIMDLRRELGMDIGTQPGVLLSDSD